MQITGEKRAGGAPTVPKFDADDRLETASVSTTLGGIALRGYAAAWTAPDAEALTDLTWAPTLPSVVRSVLVSCPLSNAGAVYIRPPTVGAGGVEIEPGGSWSLYPNHPDRIDLSGYEISGSGTDRATLLANGGDP